MPRVRWSSHTRPDILRIASHWREHNPERLPAVLTAIRQRVDWLAEEQQQAGSPIAGLPTNYRRFLERTYGYKIYYRLEGDPPEILSVITIRHAHERPLSPSTLRRYASR